MAKPPRKFAELLTTAVWRIKDEEKKNIGAIQDEIGYQLGRKGGSSIEHWRKGHLPPELSEVEQLARILVERKGLISRSELKQFLESADHPSPSTLCDVFFSTPASLTEGIHLLRPRRHEHFTDRDTELGRLLKDLKPGVVVTVWGAAGIGKSALATEVLWRLAPGSQPPQRFPDGIFWHSFYNQPQATYALEQIARFFGEEPFPTPRDAAARALAGRKALLLLDGTENTDNLQMILDVCGECGMLITTRSLKDAGALREDLKPLSPDDAVSLLQAWGGKRADDKKVAGSVCELVGWLPLAVRLAGRYLDQPAGDATTFLELLKNTPLKILDRGKRQRESVPILLERSLAQVGQVCEEAQQVAPVIGILALAPFGLAEVASAVELTEDEVTIGLAELVNYGLLLEDDSRYTVSHPLIHTYIRERLTTPTVVIERLAIYYATLVENLGKLKAEGYAQLDNEQSHLMAVLEECVKRERWQTTRNLAQVVSDHGGYFDFQGHWTERIRASEFGLTAAKALEDRHNEADWFSFLGTTYTHLGQADRAIEHLSQALAIYQEFGDRFNEVRTTGNLATAFRRQDNVERAIDLYKQALAISREIEHRRSEMATLGNLGNIYREQGNLEQAEEYYEQSLNIAREDKDRYGEAMSLGNLGIVYRRLGQPRRAIEIYNQSVVVSREVGDRYGEAFDLANLGNAHLDLEEMDQAKKSWEEALAILEEINAPEAEAVRKLLNDHKSK